MVILRGRGADEAEEWHGMDTAERAAGKAWTAEEFLETDQHEFGDAWRYELVDVSLSKVFDVEIQEN
jgi:hypothetical protein